MKGNWIGHKSHRSGNKRVVKHGKGKNRAFKMLRKIFPGIQII